MTDKIISILESYWPKNKAKGLIAQTIFNHEINNGSFGKDAKDKIMPGCWLLAPKDTNFYKFRFCFFIHPVIMKTDDIPSDLKLILKEKYRPFHALAEFMNNAGMGNIYVIAHTRSGSMPLDDIIAKNFSNINWSLFRFSNGLFEQIDQTGFFDQWGGGRGRASFGNEWDEPSKKNIRVLSEEILSELLLNELFYSGFIKGTLRKTIMDPYDVDSFLISISQKYILPMEIKEKFPGSSGENKFFGIDAGRIIMLLRICLPNDSNGIYLIRELDDTGHFIGWKYITLSDIIMTSSWNLQAGGPGMGGQSTQTIILPYTYFKSLESGAISEENLQKIGHFPKDIKTVAKDFGQALAEQFYK